jgi:hypothetical protein
VDRNAILRSDQFHERVELRELPRAAQDDVLRAERHFDSSGNELVGVERGHDAHFDGL